MKTIQCRKCGAEHELNYQRQINGALHLIYYCGKATLYAPLVKHLDIPIVESKKLRLSREQPTLL